jgi:DNA-binding Lrp family transcriptional regulator
MAVDRTDARILLALDEDPLATTMALSRQLSLARNTVQARVRALEATGALHPVTSRVRPESVGHPVIAFVTLVIAQGDIEEITAELSQVPEVLEMHAITGDGDILAKVAATDPADLHRVTRLLLECRSVVRTSTVMAVLELVPPRTSPLLQRVSGVATEPAADGRISP